jgi:two-component system, response regulator PdtaR
MARILLVEDNDLVRSMFSDALTDAGYDVAAAEDGRVAAALLREQAQFDALLTDINLPGSMNGLAVGQLFRERYPDSPIVYVSGAPNPLPQTSLQSGKDFVLNKPCTLTQLISRLDALFGSKAPNDCQAHAMG